MPNERMRVVATWYEDGARWAMRDDGRGFWWSPEGSVWHGAGPAHPDKPVPGCAIEPEEEPAAAGAGPAGLDLTYADKCRIFKAMNALRRAWFT